MTQPTQGGQEHFRAGEAAAELGVGVQTLHYYEREGLIPAPPRSGAGYRLFPPDLMERLRFIRRAQALGLSLADIRETLELAEIGESPCGRVQAALAERLAEVDRRLEQLTAFRRQLADLVENAPKLRDAERGGRVCAIVEGAKPTPGRERVNVPPGRRGRAGG
ncbi:MAG TPA: heavy metal-responsive transcriptional regulator [Longimicrobiaceae bacterium]|nr:heavy metal-responsive transcriptional regulator [Longimicrobiaceae bacterium]